MECARLLLERIRNDSGILPGLAAVFLKLQPAIPPELQAEAAERFSQSLLASRPERWLAVLPLLQRFGWPVARDARAAAYYAAAQDAAALASLGAAALPAIVTVMETDEGRVLRHACLQALMNLNERAAIPLLEKLEMVLSLDALGKSLPDAAGRREAKAAARRLRAKGGLKQASETAGPIVSTLLWSLPFFAILTVYALLAGPALTHSGQPISFSWLGSYFNPAEGGLLPLIFFILPALLMGFLTTHPIPVRNRSKG